MTRKKTREDATLKYDRQLALRSLYDFGCLMGWKDEKSAPFHRVLASHLEQVASGRIKRLLIMAPPRHGKTLWVSRYFPAWVMARRASVNFVSCSYSQDLANKNSRAVLALCQSPEFVRLFGNIFTGKSTEQERELIGGGLYRALGVGGPFAGFPANILNIDDPFKNRAEAESQTIRDSVWEWYNDDALTRLEGWPRSVVLMHTRWHDDDLAGRALKAPDAHRWTVLRFPQIQDLEDPPDYDPRELGAPLWPKMLWEPDAAEELAKGLGDEEVEVMSPEEAEQVYVEEFEHALQVNEYGTLALRQQKPINKGALLFHEDWKKYTTSAQLSLASAAERLYLSVDANYGKPKTGKSRNDRVGIAVVARIRGAFYVLDAFGADFSFTQTKKALKELAAVYPTATVVIEQAANGVALFDELRQELPSVADFEPGGTTKHSRVEYLASVAQTGALTWISETLVPRIKEAIRETWMFGQERYDDVPDAIAQAVLHDRMSTRGEKGLDRVTGDGPGSLRQIITNGWLDVFKRR